MATYITAFQSLATALEREPDVVLLGFHTFAPLSDADLDDLAARHRCVLSPAIRQFYKESNGLQLRWIFKHNPQYQAQQHPPHQNNRPPVPWTYASEHYRAEDGCIFLLPLDELLATALPPVWTDAPLALQGKTYTPLEFYGALRPLDLFSAYDSMALLLREHAAPLVLLCEEQGEWTQHAHPIAFEQYLGFLYRSLGYCLRRRQWLTSPRLLELPACRPFWTLERLRLARRFPLADQPTLPNPSVATLAMQQKAAQQVPLAPEDWQLKLTAHAQFLAAGGVGGKWSIITVQGRTIGIYQSAHRSDGQQALLDGQRLERSIDLQGLYLPYSSWCGAYLKGLDWSDADLTGSLLIDAQLAGAIFAEANLENVDFSRSNLKGASFINANLAGADFEGCDLTGADFRGAVLTGSRFKGAILHQIIV